MSTLIASLCLLTLGTPASEPSTLLLTPRSASSDVHLAARLVSGWGRISAREGKAFRIELLPNASIEHATRKLSRQSSFLFSGGGKSDPAVPGVVKRMEWEALRRENASGELDWSSLEREAEHMKAMPVADLGSRRGPTGTWQYIGPRNLYPWGQQFFGSQGNSGRVNGVAYDPNNPNTIYAAAASGGLRKSTDAGVTWQFMSGGWDMLQTSCVAVDPRPNNTVYVGTGDYHGTFSLQRQRVGRGYGMGLMKSTDGGQTWSDQVRQSSRSAFGDVAISEIIILPEAPDTVIVSTGRGQATNGKVFITTNGGLTWSSAKLSTGSEIPTSEWSGLSVSRPNGSGVRTLYAVAARPVPRVYRSVNNGASWAPLNAPSAPPSWNASYDVACSTWDPNRVYLLDSNYTDDGNGNPTSGGNVYVSTNQGVTWSTIGNNFTGSWSQAFYNFHITVAPWTDAGNVQRDCVYVGQVDLFASLTGTDVWTSIGLTTQANARTHNDQHAMALHPTNPNEALVANDGGLYRMVHNRATGAVQFTNLGHSLDVTEFYSIASHPGIAPRIMGGTQDNGTPSTPLDAFNWNEVTHWVSVQGGDGGPCFFAENNSASRYASNENLRIHKSHDGGQSWEEFTFRPGGNAWNGERTAWQAPFTIDQNQHWYIYAGSTFLYRYNLQTLQWTRFNVAFTDTTGEVLTAITIPRGQSDVIYVGTSEGKVFMSRNFGTTWVRLTSTELAGVYISKIEAHPTDPNDILVSQTALGRRNLYRCANTAAATAWTDVSGPTGDSDPARALKAPTHDIVRDPDSPGDTWYAATDLGVVMTRNAGAAWSNLTQPYGLPNLQVSAIDFNRTTRWMTIGTYGYGAWRLQVPRTGITLSFPSNTVMAGETVTGTVTASEPAPLSGYSVDVSSSNSNVNLSSSTVTIPSGATSGTFTVTFSPYLPNNTNVVMTAVLGSSTSSTTLTVKKPKLSHLNFTSNPVYGGSPNTVEGAVFFGESAQESTSVALSSSDPSVATVPASVVMNAGRSIAYFPITTKLVSTQKIVTITATLEGVSRGNDLTVDPNYVSGLSPTISPPASGTSFYFSVYMAAGAPAGGIPVTLYSDNPEYFSEFTSSITILAGRSAEYAPCRIAPTNVDRQTKVYANANGGGMSYTLQIWSPRPSQLTVTSPLVGGASGTLTTKFYGRAAPGGAVFNLSSNSNVIQVPVTDTLADNQDQKQTTFTTTPVTSTVTRTITVSRAGQSRTVNVTLTPGGLLSASANPDTIVGGASTNGFVRLSGPAPAGGTTVTLTSSSSAISVPASVIVPAGADSVGFQVNTSAVTADVQRYFEAKLGAITRRAYINLTSAGILTFSVSPNTVVGGVNTTGYVRLSSAAPAGGRTINLSTNSSALVVPATVTVPAGQIVHTFVVQTKPVGSTVQRVIYASYGGVSQHAVVTLTPPSASLTGLSFNPSGVVGGQPSTGTVTLSGAAPADGIAVSLASSSSAIQVPGTVNVAAGQATATFTATTSPVAATATRTVTASYAASSKSAAITLTPAPPLLANLVIDPNSVAGGQSTTGTVTLSGAAPTGGIVVTLSSNSSVIQVPGSVTVGAGQSSATFTITTSRVGAPATRTVSASSGSVTKAANLTLNP